jgi:hypothetical protein
MVTTVIDIPRLRTLARFAPGLPVGYYSREAPLLRFASRSAAAAIAKYAEPARRSYPASALKYTS